MAFRSLHRSPIVAEPCGYNNPAVIHPAAFGGRSTVNRFSHSASNTILSCYAALGLLASSTFASQMQKAADDDPDVKELASYTLSMNKIHHVAGATNGLKEWEQRNPDLAIGMDGDEPKNAGRIT